MENVLLAGATGYLGQYILKELLNRTYQVRAIARSAARLPKVKGKAYETVIAQVADAASIAGCCEEIDVVMSTVGITRQRDGLSYMDVDFQANVNLLNEALKAGVKKFIYVSVLNGRRLRHLKMCEAKERFVDYLIGSGIDYCIIRPNGFFSDMAEFYNMAKKGRVYLFGGGTTKANPIDGEDLAVACVDSFASKEKEIEIGGPEVLSQKEIVRIAFGAARRREQITCIPDWIRRTVLFIVRKVFPQKTYGPIEFFLTVLAMDMIAPPFGQHRLEQFFMELGSGHK